MIFISVELYAYCICFGVENPSLVDMNTCQPQRIVIRDSPTTTGRTISTKPQHLKSCQMFSYNPIPLPPAFGYSGNR